MKGALDFDPAQHEFGPATIAIRNLLDRWSAVDWLTPPGASADVARAHFATHRALGREASPELFVNEVVITAATGGWDDFVHLCQRVRAHHAFDWKFSVLKRLSRQHSQACGWTIDDLAVDLAGERGREGTLFAQVGMTVFWRLRWRRSLAALSAPHADAATFYLSYADMDAIEAIEWQLAEPTCDLVSNPFVPLLACYEEGWYPFVLAADAVVLFAFAA